MKKRRMKKCEVCNSWVDIDFRDGECPICRKLSLSKNLKKETLCVRCGNVFNTKRIDEVYCYSCKNMGLGLKYHSVDRTKNGYYIGFNATYDDRIRNKECVSNGFYDIRRHQGARRVRLTELMEENKGKLNIEVAKKMISDHYDVYLLKGDNPCSRTVCAHYELDAREYMSETFRPKPFAPRGAVDGCITDATLVKEMTFYGRYGNSCGMAFNKDEFCKKHIQFANYRDYLKDRPTQPWTKFTIHKFQKKRKANKSKSKAKTSSKKTMKNKNKILLEENNIL
jgi:hypothetical protein